MERRGSSLSSIDDEGGRGLRIVDLLSQRWGVENRPGGRGKSTWFTVSVGPQAVPTTDRTV